MVVSIDSVYSVSVPSLSLSFAKNKENSCHSDSSGDSYITTLEAFQMQAHISQLLIAQSRIICVQIANKLSSPCIPSVMAEANIQLLMTADSITVNASMFEGVLTKKTFEGPDCYLKLVDFLKQSFFANQVIHVVIVVN